MILVIARWWVHRSKIAKNALHFIWRIQCITQVEKIQINLHVWKEFEVWIGGRYENWLHGENVDQSKNSLVEQINNKTKDTNKLSISILRAEEVCKNDPNGRHMKNVFFLMFVVRTNKSLALNLNETNNLFVWKKGDTNKVDAWFKRQSVDSDIKPAASACSSACKAQKNFGKKNNYMGFLQSETYIIKA